MSPDREALAAELRDLNGQGYGAYKSLGRTYAFSGFELRFDHVQGDPFSEPTRVRVRVPAPAVGLPPSALTTDRRRVSAADYLNRRLFHELKAHSTRRGSGRSGELTILEPSGEVLRRTSVRAAADGSVEARFRAGLPSLGRSILGNAAAELLCEALPAAIEAALLSPGIDRAALERHIEVVEDAQALRAQLAARGLVAFVADGAVLPRRSGIDDRPMEGEAVIPFASPPSLRVVLDTPNAGSVSGMGVPEGVTLLVGGGFHGKSTLLRAIERGVYDHVPGDGRERVVTRADVVKVRAEDGRSVDGTDISNFIGLLPSGEHPEAFRTGNASGSTSQAAAIAEALEVGARCLLLDEDTSATNFLIRDARVQALVANDDEPITPLIDRVADLRARGISLVLVVGGSGDYFDVADTVVAMRSYRPLEVTEAARATMARIPTVRTSAPAPWREPDPRRPDVKRINPRRGSREVEVKVHSVRRMTFGVQELDLTALEQLVEVGQTRAIGRALAWARERCIDGRTTVQEALACLEEHLARSGLDLVDDREMGEYAEFRPHEFAAVLNRLRAG